MNDTKELNQRRIDDLNLLLSIRKNDNYLWKEDIIRNYYLIFAISLSSLDNDTAIKKFKTMSKQLTCKSKNFYKEMLKKLTKFCRHFAYTNHNRYRYSDEKIIELLEITDIELNCLKSITSKAMKEIKEEQYLNSKLEEERIEREINKSIITNEQREFLSHYKDEAIIELENRYEQRSALLD